MEIYANPGASGARIVQYVTLGATLVGAFVFMTEGAAEMAPVVLAIGAACLVGFEFRYVRNQVTSVARDANGWALNTLSTLGERTVRFDASQARLGNAFQRQSLYGETATSYPFFVAGRTYMLDSTPPARVDVAAFLQNFPS
ncbi:MAG: hypothetical protein R3C31_03155 [Hyphomonadaceae bacterium]